MIDFLRLVFSRQPASHTKVQMLRYFFVAAVATLFDYGFYLIGLKALGWHYAWAIVIGFSIGVTINYLLSMQWAFEKPQQRNYSKEFSLFALTGIGGIFINTTVVFILLNYFKIEEGIGRIPAIALAFIWNFYSKKWFVFRD